MDKSLWDHLGNCTISMQKCRGRLPDDRSKMPVGSQSTAKINYACTQVMPGTFYNCITQ